ncbi:MAG: hypothetical protein JO243_14100 [Solirubrobacterales bacterium]|nr:hypothetical protein [Solirubrobacterales bacterium]
MSWFETDEPVDGAEGDGWGREPGIRRWPLHWEGLYPRERWLWFEQLWSDACSLQRRYHLPLRSNWWADQVQVETLAALAALVERHDSGEWDDPPGKLALLCDLERVAHILKPAPSHFIQSAIGSRSRGTYRPRCQPPPGDSTPGPQRGR